MASDDPTKSLLGNRLDASELFSLLESRDTCILEEVKALVHENLHTSRESWFLYALVDYYLQTKSNRCLDILIGIREPHDKHLFDKIQECLKGQQWREEALGLLSHVVRKQPSWLHHITSHKVLPALLQLLKNDTNIPHLMTGLLTVVTLLPIVTALAAPHLPDIFEVFARLATWNTKKTGNVPEVYFLHLRVALYHLFCRLYAMYPCNFLAFLRSHYGGSETSREGRENLYVFSETIKPMLERVRLHPLLVTASKETELSVARWKNLEPHDIIVQCSKVSLDTLDGLPQEEAQETGSGDGGRPAQSQAINIVRQWSFAESLNTHLPIQPGSLVGDTLDMLTMAPEPCPLKICDFSPTSEIQEPQEDDHQEGLNSLVTSMASVTSKTEYEMDFEVAENKAQQDDADGLSTSKDLSKTESSGGISRSSEGDVVTAEEAKEESQKQDLSLNGKKQQQGQQQFVSTTDTLTTTVTFSDVDDGSSGLANCSLSSSSAQEDEVGVPLTSLGGASNILLERLVHGINRLRFFSHCGHPPEIPMDWLRRSPTLRKSHSWPVLKSETFTISPRETTHPVGSPTSTSSNTNKSSYVQEPASNRQTQESFSSSKSLLKQRESPEAPTVPPPIIQSPVVTKETSPPPAAAASAAASQPCKGQCLHGGPHPAPTTASPTHFTYPSPSDLLDTYLHLGSKVYLQGLSLTSGKDTNWTHFGGPAPADEMTILRGEITLLHTQLLFERYRREVHAERNRRLLGKAKKARALEEQNMALKDHLALQEKEILELNQKLKLSQVIGHDKTPAPSQDLHDHLRLLQEDNWKLDAGKQKMEHCLEQQHHEIAALRTTLDETQCHLQEIMLELEAVRREANRCSQLEHQVKHLTCQLAVAYELHQRFVDKVEHQIKPTDFDFHINHLKESATHDIEELKRQSRSQSNDIEAFKMRVEMLEQALASKDLIIEEQKQLLETVKSSHKDIVKAKMDRIHCLQSICHRQEEHILELQSRLCVQDTLTKSVPLQLRQLETECSSEWHPAMLAPTSGIRTEAEGATAQDPSTVAHL